MSTAPPAKPTAPGTPSKPKKVVEGIADVVVPLVFLLLIGFVVVKGCGMLLAEPDASFELSDCVLNRDGSVTVVGTVRNEGASGEVNIEPYVVLMGGERHSAGVLDTYSRDFEKGESAPFEGLVTLDSGDIPTSECGAEIR